MENSLESSPKSFEGVAAGLSKVGMLVPFYLFLEIHKPIRGMSMLVFEGFEPLLQAAMGRNFTLTCREVLSSEESYESFLRFLKERT